MDSPLDYVETLAEALDHDDFVTAASVMAGDVVYSIGGKQLTGRDAVVESYRAASAMARRVFEHVEYSHEVIRTDDSHFFRVSYSDLLTAGSEVLTHMAEQHVTVEPGVGVAHIENVDLPGEKEKVDKFLERHGVTRDG